MDIVTGLLLFFGFAAASPVLVSWCRYIWDQLTISVDIRKMKEKLEELVKYNESLQSLWLRPEDHPTSKDIRMNKEVARRLNTAEEQKELLKRLNVWWIAPTNGRLWRWHTEKYRPYIVEERGKDND